MQKIMDITGTLLDRLTPQRRLELERFDQERWPHMYNAVMKALSTKTNWLDLTIGEADLITTVCYDGKNWGEIHLAFLND